MNVCIIPARGGSKRIPGKNVRSFCGEPIIAFSIKAAIKSACFDKVIVSTDDKAIAEVAKRYGAKVPFLRPEELSNDYAGTLPVIKHALEWLEEHGNTIEFVCCLYATAPFIKAEFLQKAYEQLISRRASYCFSVTSFPFPIQRAVKVSQNDRLEMFYPEYFSTRSQDLEEAYHDAGQFYWGKAEAFKQQIPLFSEHATPFITPRYLVQDIDTLEDWKRAEFMYQVLLQAEEF